MYKSLLNLDSRWVIFELSNIRFRLVAAHLTSVYGFRILQVPYLSDRTLDYLPNHSLVQFRGLVSNFEHGCSVDFFSSPSFPSSSLIYFPPPSSLLLLSIEIYQSTA